MTALFEPDNHSPQAGWPERLLAGLRTLALGILVAVALMTLLFALPVLLPILAWDQALTRRRQLAALASTGCVVCGRSLRSDALDLADAVWRSEQPVLPAGRIRRVVRRLHAICPACGARYEWDREHRRFQRLPEAV